MAKSPIVMKYSLSVSGILNVDAEEGIVVEMPDGGTQVLLKELLEDFDGKGVKIGVSYDEEY